VSRSPGVEFAAAGEVAVSAAVKKLPMPKVGPFVPLVARMPNASRDGARASKDHDSVVAEIKLGTLVVRVFSGADQETLRALLQTLQECTFC
jgi:hypothetical protein